MRRYISVGLSIFILGLAVFGAGFWIRAFYASVEMYQPVIQPLPSPPAVSLPQETNLVVILVGGLGNEDFEALNMPNLARLAQTGASTVIQSVPPSFSQTSQATLITGAWPELNGVPPLAQPPEELGLINTDTIFAQAHEARQKTAIFGPASWRRLLPRNHLDETFFINAAGPEADQAIVNAALPALKENRFDLVLIHLTQMDFAAQHQGGTAGNAYRQAARRIDSLVQQLSQAVDVSRSGLMILSDHGYTSAGGSGGAELEVIQQPFIMLGPNVIPGGFSPITSLDIAPTIATFLGTAPPDRSQGRILFEMFQLSKQDQTVAQLGLAQQRLTLGTDYLSQISGGVATLPDTLLTDLEQAQAELAKNNIGGAFQLAQLTQTMADTQIAAARHSRIKAQQWPRLLMAGFGLLLWLGLMWQRRGAHAGIIIVAAIITVGLYHLLYQLQGHSYSISALTNISQMPFDVARRTAVSLLAGGGLVLVLLMLVNEENWLTLLGTGYGFGVLVTFIFALPLFWAYWQNGATIDWYYPAVNTVFWQVTSLLEVMMAAILGLLLPWPITLLNLFVNLARRRLDEHPARAEPDALPGLHL